MLRVPIVYPKMLLTHASDNKRSCQSCFKPKYSFFIILCTIKYFKRYPFNNVMFPSNIIIIILLYDKTICYNKKINLHHASSLKRIKSFVHVIILFSCDNLRGHCQTAIKLVKVGSSFNGP